MVRSHLASTRFVAIRRLSGALGTKSRTLTQGRAPGDRRAVTAPGGGDMRRGAGEEAGARMATCNDGESRSVASFKLRFTTAQVLRFAQASVALLSPHFEGHALHTRARR